MSETWSPQISRETFIRRYIEQSSVPEQKIRESQIALPCDCDSAACQGWQMLTRGSAAHEEWWQDHPQWAEEHPEDAPL